MTYCRYSLRLEENLHCKLDRAVVGDITRHTIEFADAVAELGIARRTRAAAHVQDGGRRRLLEIAEVREELRLPVYHREAGVREEGQPGVEAVELRVVKDVERL